MSMFDLSKYTGTLTPNQTESSSNELAPTESNTAPIESPPEAAKSTANITITGPLSRIYATALLKLFGERGSNLIGESMAADGTTILISTDGEPEEVAVYATDASTVDHESPLDTAKKLTLALDDEAKNKLLVVENMKGGMKEAYLVEYAESLPNTKIMFSRESAISYIRGLIK